MNGDEYDVIVIGAGISGIYSAKFYLSTHPDSRLLILDRDSCVGGTWNRRRGYDNFWTQWSLGTAEFSDMPMPRPPEEDIYYEFFKAKYTTKYLEGYVDQKEHDGRTLRERILLGVEVQSLLKVADGWTVSAKERTGSTVHKFHTAKVIVASGLTSIPNMPTIPGRESFNGPVIHQEDFGASSILSSSDITHITVLGGGKSSADMVYAAVKAGKKVNWVLKESETTGPGFFMSPKGKGPYKNAFEIGMTRLAGTFTPSFLNGENWWTRFLHESGVGVKLTGGFWNGVNEQAVKAAGYKERQSVMGFEKLEPHSPVFWQNCTGGLLHHDDFFETIASHVQVYCGDTSHLEKGFLCLKKGERIPTDALLCGTGWVSSLRFFTEEQCQTLGLPHPRDEDSKATARWTQLESSADKQVLSKFPLLANPPKHYHRSHTLTPFRLYKQMVPLSDTDRSIVFIGQVGVGNYFTTVQCQAMWAIAYMDGKLEVPSLEEREMDVALFISWCRRRYLSSGEEGNSLVFEVLGYTDGLLSQLGLSSHRRGWFKDLFAPVMASNFTGLQTEYIRKYGLGSV